MAGAPCVVLQEERDVLATLTDSVRESLLVDGLVGFIGQRLGGVAIEDRESGHSPGQM
jgi:hypothetical protein